MTKHALPISTTFPPLGMFTPPEGLKFLKDHGFDSMDFNFVAALELYGRNWQDMIEEVKRIADAEENGIEIDEKLYEQLKEICDNLDIDIDSYLEE